MKVTYDRVEWDRCRTDKLEILNEVVGPIGLLNSSTGVLKGDEG